MVVKGNEMAAVGSGGGVSGAGDQGDQEEGSDEGRRITKRKRCEGRGGCGTHTERKRDGHVSGIGTLLSGSSLFTTTPSPVPRTSNTTNLNQLRPPPPSVVLNTNMHATVMNPRPKRYCPHYDYEHYYCCC